MSIIKTIVYTTSTKKKPFTIWLDELDTKSAYLVTARLIRVRDGDFGDCKQLVSGGRWRQGKSSA